MWKTTSVLLHLDLCNRRYTSKPLNAKTLNLRGGPHRTQARLRLRHLFDVLWRANSESRRWRRLHSGNTRPLETLCSWHRYINNMHGLQDYKRIVIVESNFESLPRDNK